MIELHVEYRTVIDDLEPLEISPADLREAAQKYVAIMNAFAAKIQTGFRDRNAEVAFWGCCYGLGLSNCEGVSMTEKAEQLGVTRATISKTARSFVEANNLKPSWHMKQETSNYIESRLKQVAASNGNSNGASPA